MRFRILLLPFKCLNGLAPPYLCNLKTKNMPRRNLRPINGHRVVDFGYKLTRYGSTVFSVASAKLWNALPLEFRSSDNYFWNASATLGHILLGKLSLDDLLLVSRLVSEFIIKVFFLSFYCYFYSLVILLVGYFTHVFLYIENPNPKCWKMLEVVVSHL